MLHALNKKLLQNKRTENLTTAILDILPNNSSALGIECGNTLISKNILNAGKIASVTDVDILNGENNLSYDDASFDTVMLLDCLHHTNDPLNLLQESKRITKKFLIIKDHLCENKFDQKLLYFMDSVGNKSCSVPLPANYWSRKQWEKVFNILELNKITFQIKFKYYPQPISWVFGRSLHFLSLLVPY